MRRTGRYCASIVVLAAAGAALAASPASAGEYAADVCLIDSYSMHTKQLAVPGMANTNRCGASEDSGVATGNVSAAGTVGRGARAEVVLEAPPGTLLASLEWSGRARRIDCRYALQIWAEVPGAPAIPIFNLPANQGCPKRGRAQATKIVNRAVPLGRATRIVQRVTCVGAPRRARCSRRHANFLSTDRVRLSILDTAPPSATILGTTPLARGEWVRGRQSVNYDATENAGLSSASVGAGGKWLGEDRGPCKLADPRAKVFTRLAPCGSSGGEIEVDTSNLPDGTHSLGLSVHDIGGNSAQAVPAVIRVDNNPPGRVDVGVEGGQEWRSSSDFSAMWNNAVEPDRAPIAAAAYKVCPTGGGECFTGEHIGPDISRFGVKVPSPGEWTISIWRRDSAGNQAEIAASVPVPLRYDPDAPKVAFEARSVGDPTLVAARVSDAVSGVASGAIEISQAGSGVWRELPVERQGDRLVARVDDSSFPPGPYRLRARVLDHARNETVTDVNIDGHEMTVNLPLRVVSTLQTAFERVRTIRETVRRGGRDRQVGRRVVVQTHKARVLFGETAQVAGRLVDPAGNGFQEAEVQVLATPSLGAEQVIGAVKTDADGRFRYMAAASTDRTLRFVYAGSDAILPAESRLSMTVPAAMDLKVDRTRLRNGQTVTFSGPVLTLPTPPGGKLIEMQVRLPGRWETFRTIRSDDAGSWSVRYRFRRTTGTQYYRFRARLPAEGNYPFGAGLSRSITVRVRGT